MVISKIDKLIVLTEKKIKLLNELRCSVLEEQAKIIIDNRIVFENKLEFIVFDKSIKKVIFTGSKTQTLNYLGKKELTQLYWRSLKEK